MGQAFITRRGNAKIITSPIFGDNPWEVINLVSMTDIALNILTEEQIYAKYGWRLGDEKVVNLTNGNTQIAKIIDYNKDTLTTPNGTVTKAGITFDFKNSFPTLGRINSTETNVGSWNASEARTSTSAMPAGGINYIRNLLPADMKGVIKKVNKITAQTYNGSTNQISSDDLWLLAVAEIFKGDVSYGQGGTAGQQTGYSNLAEFNALTAYKHYENNRTTAFRVKKQGDNGSAIGWWLRSPNYSDNRLFCYVGSAGGPVNYIPTNSFGISPGFCI